MTTLLDSPPMSVVEALRGDRASRPRSDRTSAGGLRARLEDGIFETLGGSRPTPALVVRASCLRQHHGTTDLGRSTQGRLRGVLVAQLLRLHCVGATVDDAYEDALEAWRVEDPSNDLLGVLDRLDEADRARLAADVTAHGVTLGRSLGAVPSRWMPRTTVRAAQHLAGASVVLRDVVDLMVGTTSSDVASVVLLDVTTAPLGGGAERAMRYHALVQTLRTSTAPLRTAAFSSATGDLWVLDVDHELLARSVDEVLDAISQQWALR